MCNVSVVIGKPFVCADRYIHTINGGQSELRSREEGVYQHLCQTALQYERLGRTLGMLAGLNGQG